MKKLSFSRTNIDFLDFVCLKCVNAKVYARGFARLWPLMYALTQGQVMKFRWNFVEISIFFVLIICLKIYNESDAFNLKCIISDVDGNKYCVRERSKLELAANLLAKKYSVQVFDKARGPGGRSSNKRFKNNLSFDHGVQYISPKSKIFTKFIKKLYKKKILKSWDDNHIDFTFKKRSKTKKFGNRLRGSKMPKHRRMLEHPHSNLYGSW